MSYIEVELDKIEDNPFQTRIIYNEEALAGIMSTASDHLGIRYAPIVRLHPKKQGYYQIASGHGRILALRAMGRNKATVKVANLTDSQMKTEILVENVNRSDLSEDERYNAIEAIRLDPDTDDPKIRLMLRNKENGWITELSKKTGIPTTTLHDVYDVKEMRTELQRVSPTVSHEATREIIRATVGLEKDERSKLIVKAEDRRWNRPAVLAVKKTIRDMEPNVKQLVLEDEDVLTPSIIEELGDVKDSEKQQRLIHQIQRQRLDEKTALQRIQRVKEHEPLDITLVKNEYAEVLEEIRKTAQDVQLWGINQYMILGEKGWNEASKYFNDIENHMRWLKKAEFLRNVR